MKSPATTAPVVLITGAARRIGAVIAQTLHGDGWNVVIHAHRSAAEGERLVAALNTQRADSAQLLTADLGAAAALESLAQAAHARWRRLDALVNNASSYFKTPLGTLTAAQLDDLLSSNLRAPLLLTQACFPLFGEQGAVVNIVDTQVRRPHPPFTAYFAAKAGLWAQTEALALEMAPRVRVNAVAPGHTLWADHDGGIAAAEQPEELARIPLRRLASPDDIARAVRFLLSDQASYITGAILPVDGGLRLR